jgi:hypothetical protein
MGSDLALTMIGGLALWSVLFWQMRAPYCAWCGARRKHADDCPFNDSRE